MQDVSQSDIGEEAALDVSGLGGGLHPLDAAVERCDNVFPSRGAGDAGGGKRLQRYPAGIDVVEVL